MIVLGLVSILRFLFPYVVRCAIWYRLYNLKSVRKTHRGVLLLIKLQTSACNFTKSNTPPWVFFAFLKLYKWYQIVQSITYAETKSSSFLKLNFQKYKHTKRTDVLLLKPAGYF